MTDETGEKAQLQLRLTALRTQIEDFAGKSAAVQEIVDCALEMIKEGTSDNKKQELRARIDTLQEHPEVQRWQEMRTAIDDVRRRLNIRVVK